MKTHLFAALSILSLMASASSLAARTADSEEEACSVCRAGLGIATFDNVGGNGTALSAWLETSPTTSLEPFFSIGALDPIQVGGGAAYRSIIQGSRAAGFHIGGLLNVGRAAVGATGILLRSTAASNKFYATLGPIAGFQFAIPNLSSLQVSLDGGFQLNFIEGDFNGNAGALSPALGLSVHYFL